MTSKEFYAVFNSAFASAFKEKGLQKAPGTTSAWFKACGDRIFVFEVAKGVKNPYIPPIGGQFNTKYFLIPEERGVKARYTDYCILPRYYAGEAEMCDLEAIRKAIINKIISQPEPVSKFDKMLLESSIGIMKLDLRQPCPYYNSNFLPYLDAEDCRLYAGHFLRVIDLFLTEMPAHPQFF